VPGREDRPQWGYRRADSRRRYRRPYRPRFSEEDLVRTAAAVLARSGTATDAQLVATSLALSNLVGHDSHGSCG